LAPERTPGSLEAPKLLSTSLIAARIAGPCVPRAKRVAAAWKYRDLRRRRGRSDRARTFAIRGDKRCLCPAAASLGGGVPDLRNCTDDDDDHDQYQRAQREQRQSDLHDQRASRELERSAR